MHTLISIGDLISKGLTAVKETWKPTLKYTIWFLLAPLLWYGLVLISLFPAMLIAGEGALATPSLGIGLFFLWAISFIAMMLGLFYAWIALAQYMLAYAKGESMTEWKPREPLSYVPGMFWISLLCSLPVFAVSFVAILPALAVNDANVAGLLVALLMIAAMVFIIWMSVAFSQAYYLLLTDKARGIAALKGSLALVNGRWWQTLWRLLIPALLFYMLASMIIGAVFLVMFMILFVFVGGWAAIMSTSGADAGGANLGFGIVGIILMIVFGLIAFVISIAQSIAQVLFQADVGARTFWSLEATKHKTPHA